MYLNYINYLLVQGKLGLIFLHDLQRTANDMVVELASRLLYWNHFKLKKEGERSMSLPLAFRYFISHFFPCNYIYLNSLIPHLPEWDLLCTALNTWRVSNRQVGRNEQYPVCKCECPLHKSGYDMRKVWGFSILHFTLTFSLKHFATRIGRHFYALALVPRPTRPKNRF